MHYQIDFTMKKTTLSLLFALATVSFAFSQNLKIIKPGSSQSSNDSTVTVFGLSSASEIDQILYVINTTGSAIVTNVRREIIDTVPGSTNAICWAGSCYGPGLNQSPFTENIGPGDTAKNGGNEFSGDYYPHGHAGITTIRYVFFDTHNANDTAWVNIRYVATVTGISSVKDGEINFSAPYPNPANSLVNFNYNLGNSVQAASLKVYNLLGDCVQTLPLSASKNKTSIDVQSLPSGIYVCEIEADGCQPVYQKMIVSH